MSQENFLDICPSLHQGNEICNIKAKIIGVGGAGVSLVDGLRFDNFDAVDNLAVDVDLRTLSDSLASEKLSFGRRHTRGMGTGGEYALARRAIEEEKDLLRKQLDGVDLVFLLAGLGGGTGGGVAPVVARIARESGALVLLLPQCLLAGRNPGMPRQRNVSRILGNMPMLWFPYPMIPFCRWEERTPLPWSALRRRAVTSAGGFQPFANLFFRRE